MWHSCGGPEHNPSNFGHDSFAYRMHRHDTNVNYYYNSTFSVKCDFKPLADGMKYQAKANFWTSAMNNVFGLVGLGIMSKAGNGGGGTSFLGNLIGGLAGGIGGGNYGGGYTGYGAAGSLSSAPHTQFDPWQFVQYSNTPAADDDKDKTKVDGDKDKDKVDDDKNNDGKPVDDKNNGGKPVDDKNNDGKPVDDKNNGGKPVDDKNNGGKPVDDKNNGGGNGAGDGKVKDSDIMFAVSGRTDTNNDGVIDDGDAKKDYQARAHNNSIHTHDTLSAKSGQAVSNDIGGMTEAKFNDLSDTQKAALKKLGITKFSELTTPEEVNGTNYPKTISFTADPTQSTDGPGGTRKQSGGRWTFVFTGEVKDGKPQYQYSEALSTVGSSGAYRQAGNEPVYSVTVDDKGVVQFETNSGAPAVHIGSFGG